MKCPSRLQYSIFKEWIKIKENSPAFTPYIKPLSIQFNISPSRVQYAIELCKRWELHNPFNY